MGFRVDIHLRKHGILSPTPTPQAHKVSAFPKEAMLASRASVLHSWYTWAGSMVMSSHIIPLGSKVEGKMAGYGEYWLLGGTMFQRYSKNESETFFEISVTHSFN